VTTRKKRKGDVFRRVEGKRGKFAEMRSSRLFDPARRGASDWPGRGREKKEKGEITLENYIPCRRKGGDALEKKKKELGHRRGERGNGAAIGTPVLGSVVFVVRARREKEGKNVIAKRLFSQVPQEKGGRPGSWKGGGSFGRGKDPCDLLQARRGETTRGSGLFPKKREGGTKSSKGKIRSSRIGAYTYPFAKGKKGRRGGGYGFRGIDAKGEGGEASFNRFLSNLTSSGGRREERQIRFNRRTYPQRGGEKKKKSRGPRRRRGA